MQENGRIHTNVDSCRVAKHNCMYKVKYSCTLLAKNASVNEVIAVLGSYMRKTNHQFLKSVETKDVAKVKIIMKVYRIYWIYDV